MPDGLRASGSSKADLVLQVGADDHLWRHDAGAPETAARFVRERLWLGPIGTDARADGLVEEWLGASLVRDGERWRVPTPEPRQALIWWEKSDVA